ncbi:Secreted protein OS=Streptomyces fumanus OX=67302 GN=GCM10018772_05840 PE=4 SV=1 [Streptomyces fumanus]
MGDYLRPVTRLLGTVTKGDDGQLTAQETDRLSVAIEEALAKAEAARAASLTADPDDDEDWDDDDQDDDDRDDEDDDGGRDHGGRGGDGDDGGADWDGSAPGDWDDWVNGPAGTARDAAPVTTLPARPALAPDVPAADDAARAQLRSDVDTLAEAGLSGTIRQIGSAAASVVQSLTNAIAAILSGGSLSGLADDDRA